VNKILILTALLVLLPTLSEAAEIHGHFRKDGTYVHPYQRSTRDSELYNNYNFPGHYNPNKGQITPGDPNTSLELYREQQRQNYMNRPTFDWNK
jgi:hypothetical protein